MAQSATVEQIATTKDGRKVVLKSDGTWRYVDHSAGEKGAIANLSFDTGVVFKSGGVKPIARATFYLLNDSLEKILTDNGFRGKDGSSVLATFAMQPIESRIEQLRGAAVTQYDRLMEEVKQHAVATAVSGFDGKGEFSAVKPGTYHLMNLTEIGRSVVLWNLKVELKPGQNSITLDQRNATEAF